VADEERRDINPLVGRVDALLRRHQETLRAIDDDVPVLTEVVDGAGDKGRAPDSAALTALADALERAVMVRLGPELDRAIERHLARAVDDALRDARAELVENMRQIVRDAVAASLEQSLSAPPPASDAD
jgi:hypothetical protein